MSHGLSIRNNLLDFSPIFLVEGKKFFASETVKSSSKDLNIRCRALLQITACLLWRGKQMQSLSTSEPQGAGALSPIIAQVSAWELSLVRLLELYLQHSWLCD